MITRTSYTIPMLLLVMVTTIAFGAIEPSVDYAPGTLIVKLKQTQDGLSKAASPQAVFSSYNVKQVEPLFKPVAQSLRPSSIRLSDFYEIRVSESEDVLRLAERMSEDEHIEYVQPNYIYTVARVPDDPEYSRQYQWPRIQAPEAWDITTGSEEVVIGVIDTGVDYEHEDLKDNIWQNPNEVIDGVDNDGNGYVDDVRGWDFVDNVKNAANGEDSDEEDNDPMDFEGHGTFVAGCAAAVSDNGTGVTGASWNSKIMPLRAGYKRNDGVGSLTTQGILDAMFYAAVNGADVLNLSFGGPFNDQAQRDMMRWAFDQGVVIVKAAGNDNSPIAPIQSTEPWVLSVAATDDLDEKATYSNYGDWVRIAAPGGNFGGGRAGIYSTVRQDRYGSKQGTSFAAPIVAGIAALVKSVYPLWSAAEITMHVVDTADNIDLDNPEYEGQLGKVGRVNAFNAVSQPFNSKPEYKISRIQIQDFFGNGNGKINAGEEAGLLLRIQNNWNDARNVTMTLRSDDPTVQILNDVVTFDQIPGISSDNNFAENPLNPFTIKVDSAAFPHNIPFELEIASNLGVEVLPFHVAVDAQVLFVDDDGNQVSELFYYEVLDSLGMPYDMWNRDTQGRLYSKLRNYDIVVWSCEAAFETLVKADQDDIKSFLTNGGNLFLAGQNIAWDLCYAQDIDDISDRNYVNQFSETNGRSQTFYELFLRSRFDKDKSAYTYVSGTQENAIGRGLEFPVFESERSAGEQSPDVISPTPNTDLVFEYPDGTGAATAWEDDYRLVNFAFGGLEAIADKPSRFEVMQRILYFFTNIQVEVQEVANAEDPTQDLLVKARVTTEKELDQVYLFWRNVQSEAYTTVVMSEQDSLYQGVIPKQPFGSEIEYIVQAFAKDGSYSAAKQHRLSITSTAPSIALETPRSTYLTLAPPVTMQASDISGIDTTSAYVLFWTRETEVDSQRMEYIGNNRFTAKISGNFGFGDSLYYQFAVRDLSAATVQGRSEVFRMLLGLENFEHGLEAWHTEPGQWGLDDSRALSGDFSVHESPGQGVNYPDNADLKLVLKDGLDLSSLSEATLSLWALYGFAAGDYAMVEASNDEGETWTPLSEPIAGAVGKFYQAQFALDAFTGPGNENVLLRFRVISDASQSGPGLFIDDISILPMRTRVETAQDQTVLDFELFENYPNPFNATTVIRYALPHSSPVRLSVFNTRGQQIATLVDEKQTAGRHTVTWNGVDSDGKGMPSGIYFYQLQAGEFKHTGKMTLVR